MPKFFEYTQNKPTQNPLNMAFHQLIKYQCIFFNSEDLNKFMTLWNSFYKLSIKILKVTQKLIWNAKEKKLPRIFGI